VWYGVWEVYSYGHVCMAIQVLETSESSNTTRTKPNIILKDHNRSVHSFIFHFIGECVCRLAACMSTHDQHLRLIRHVARSYMYVLWLLSIHTDCFAQLKSCDNTVLIMYAYDKLVFVLLACKNNSRLFRSQLPGSTASINSSNYGNLLA